MHGVGVENLARGSAPLTSVGQLRVKKYVVCLPVPYVCVCCVSYNTRRPRLSSMPADCT